MENSYCTKGFYFSDFVKQNGKETFTPRFVNPRSWRQFVFVDPDRVHQQMAVRPLWLPEYDPDLYSFHRHLLGTTDLLYAGYLCPQIASSHADDPTVADFLWVCRVHELESSEQHCRDLPTGESSDHSSDHLDTFHFVRQEVLLANQSGYCECFKIMSW